MVVEAEADGIRARWLLGGRSLTPWDRIRDVRLSGLTATIRPDQGPAIWLSSNSLFGYTRGVQLIAHACDLRGVALTGPEVAVLERNLRAASGAVVTGTRRQATSTADRVRLGLCGVGMGVTAAATWIEVDFGGGRQAQWVCKVSLAALVLAGWGLTRRVARPSGALRLGRSTRAASASARSLSE